MTTLTTHQARGVLTNLQEADEGTRQLGVVVLALAEEVERLGREVQDLTRRAR